MTVSTPHFRPILALLVAALSTFAADPMPYDSIGNPLNKLPASDKTIQAKGDSLNMVPNRVRVNQAGYRQKDVAAGYAKFYYVGTAPVFDVVNDAGIKVASGTLAPMGVTVSGKIVAYASNSAEHSYNGEGDWKKGYPMTGTVGGHFKRKHLWALIGKHPNRLKPRSFSLLFARPLRHFSGSLSGVTWLL